MSKSDQRTAITKAYDAHLDSGWSRENAKDFVELIHFDAASKDDIQDVRTEIQDVRTEIQDVRTELIKWMAGFGMATIASVIAMGAIVITILLTR